MAEGNKYTKIVLGGLRAFYIKLETYFMALPFPVCPCFYHRMRNHITGRYTDIKLVQEILQVFLMYEIEYAASDT